MSHEAVPRYLHPRLLSPFKAFGVVPPNQRFKPTRAKKLARSA